jgi:pimeloyl-ACP methyl ester carboxylesterase
MTRPWRPKTRVSRTALALGFAASVVPAVIKLAVASDSELLNVPAPTLGGKQLWRDAYVHAGWRIQRNVVTGHIRLLDPGQVRRAWGSYAYCKERFDTMRKEKGIKPRSSHMVLLVHGIGRSTGTFSDLTGAVDAVGYDAEAISYPSTRGTIEEHAAGITRLLERAEGVETVSFVTHSMGALVVRHLLAAGGPWRERMALGRVVMIAPPNQGSAVARWLKEVPLYRGLFGKAGQQLTPDGIGEAPMMDVPFGIIAGGRGYGSGYNPILPGDDDGTVTVAETRLEGAADFLIVTATHGRITNNPQTILATANFLKHGHFGNPGQKLKRRRRKS